MNAGTDAGQVLSVRDLKVRFSLPGGAIHAVRGVDLDLAPGERLGLVGESGSGKSALALSLLGLIDPPGEIAGEVRLHGRPIDHADDRSMSAIRGGEVTIVFQDPLTGLNPVQRIGRQLTETLRLHTTGLTRRQARARAIELLQDVELPRPERCVDAYPHQLSGGMRQRVMIAMALANDPAVLIADEPTTALDITTQARVLEVLNRLVDRRDTAVVLITHNLDIVADFCDRVMVMYAGRIVEQGPTTQVLDLPAHPYTAALRAAIPRLDADREEPLLTLPGMPPQLQEPPPGCAFAPRCLLPHDAARCTSLPPPTVTVAGANDRRSECHFVDRMLGTQT